MSESQQLLHFAKKYIEMRRRQKEYFRAKTGLEECKRLERELDKEAEAIALGTVPSLFDAEVPS